LASCTRGDDESEFGIGVNSTPPKARQGEYAAKSPGMGNLKGKLRHSRLSRRTRAELKGPGP
jgi:hypothetical protein